MDSLPLPFKKTYYRDHRVYVSSFPERGIIQINADKNLVTLSLAVAEEVARDLLRHAEEMRKA